MNITIDHEVLLQALLKGDMMDCCIVSEAFKDAFVNSFYSQSLSIPQDCPFSFEPSDIGTKKGYVLWSKLGWENELKRRAYIDGLPDTLDVMYKPKLKRTRETVQKELMAASVAGDLEMCRKLAEEIKAMQ